MTAWPIPTPEAYRAFWMDNWQTEGFRAVLRDALYLPVWDDHEVTNNWYPGEDLATDPSQADACDQLAQELEKLKGKPQRRFAAEQRYEAERLRTPETYIKE